MGSFLGGRQREEETILAQASRFEGPDILQVG